MRKHVTDTSSYCHLFYAALKVQSMWSQFEPVSSLPSVTGTLSNNSSSSIVSCWPSDRICFCWRKFMETLKNTELILTSCNKSNDSVHQEIPWCCTSVCGCVWLAVCVYLCYCHSDTLWQLDLLLGSKVISAQQSVFSGKTDAVLVPKSELSPNSESFHFLLHQSWWEKGKLWDMSHIWGDSDRSKDSFFTYSSMPYLCNLSPSPDWLLSAWHALYSPPQVRVELSMCVCQ